MALVLVPAVALALPQGGQVTARSASIAHTGNTLTVTQTSGKTAIDWQGFSIGAGQSVKFRQPGAIIAQGGVVLLSASAKAALLRTVVSETGLVEAGSAVCRSAGRSRCRAARRAPWRCRARLMRTLLPVRADHGDGCDPRRDDRGARRRARRAVRVCRNLGGITSIPRCHRRVGADSPLLTFSGTFEGLGHTISNLKVTGGSDVGLLENESE
ncbi:hypothetical protein ICJ77_13255 [Acidiphilium multivorum]|nr:hypothetical protein [Acidiphilium multivorum]